MSQILRDNLRAALDARKISINKGATAAGISPAALKMFLNGTTETLTVPTLGALAGWLGMTVGALLGEAAARTDGSRASAGIVDIRLDALHASPLNPRKTFATESLDELAASIREQGLLENLVVRHMAGDHHETPGPNYWIVAGERRLRALRQLASHGSIYKHHAVPCRIVEADDAQHVVLALLENVQREDVPPLEEADGFKALVADGWGTDKIAETIGKTRRHVQLRLALLDKLAPEAQAALTAGDITVEQARALTVASVDEQVSALERIAGGWNGWQRAADLRNSLLSNQYPVARAAFKKELYTGDIIDADSDDPRYADTAQFERLQLEAAGHKVLRLAGKWAWAELMDEDESQYFHDYLYEDQRSKDRGNAGCVVVIEHDRSVHVHIGLVLKEAAAMPVTGRADSDDGGTKSPFTKSHLEFAKRVKTEALQEAVAADGQVALRLAVLGMLGATGIQLGRDGFDGPGGFVAPALVKIFERHKSAFKGCRDDWRSDRDAVLAIDRASTISAKAYGVLQAMDDTTVMEIFAALVAAQFGTFAGHNVKLGDDPLPCMVADELGVDMAARDLLTEDYLAGCRKPQLVEIAQARGIGRPGDDDRPVDGMTAKALRARLVEVAGDGSGRLDGYVPRELRFGSTADLENAAAEYPAAAEKQVAA